MPLEVHDMPPEPEKLSEWVDEGLITPEQADAIRTHEQQARSGKPPSARVPLATEAVGYLGGGLAAIAAVLFVAQLWPSLEGWAKVAFVGVITAVLTTAGALIRRSEEPAIARLCSFLWFLSAGGVAFFFALVASELAGLEDASIGLVASAAAAAYSLALWAIRKSPLQQIALFATIVSAAVSLLLVVDEGLDPVFFGLAIWGIGLAGGLLAWAELFPPARTGVTVAAAAMLLGAQFASFDAYRGWGLLLALRTAAGLLAAGIIVRRNVLLALGTLGVIVFVPQTVAHVFGDSLGAVVALLVAGLLLVIGAIGAARFRAGSRSHI
jgi:hypothetical protein